MSNPLILRQRFSTELFSVKEVLSGRRPYMFTVENQDGEVLNRRYYAKQLALVKKK